ncbi:hypothetical protein [Kineococcus sp. SYSU DK005]|uniref:hypothetical protein n=1 Tax=Kineococcus sp. SYSU DK005 TaxID=3383126 RepID=UPI003D7CDAC1
MAGPARLSVRASVRMDGTGAGAGADLPLPRVALVPAPDRPLLHDHDELEDLREWPLPVSVDFAGPAGVSRYAAVSTFSQRVTCGGAAVLLDSASGEPPWQPRLQVLGRDPEDWGLLWPFAGWWVWPDITTSFSGRMSFTVRAPVRWGPGGGERCAQLVLTLALREH